jgi:hypothetical protein
LRAIKWIGEQHFDPRFAARNPDIMPVRIAAGALGLSMPVRDLYVSPGHAMLVDDMLVLARNLVNGITITKPQCTEDIHYFNIEFETHDCIMAEGSWSESFADGPGLRNQFHNAADFYQHFPGYVAPDEVILCAPRPLAGPALAKALAPVLARTPIVPGKLHGWVDAISPDGRIAGWAQYVTNPEYPVALEIFMAGVGLGSALACEWRGDLAKAGLGSGRCGFEFMVPFELSDAMRQSIRVVRRSSLVALPNADVCRASLGMRVKPVSRSA